MQYEVVQKIKKIWNFVFVFSKAKWENNHEIDCTKDWFKSYNIQPCSRPGTIGFYLLQNPEPKPAWILKKLKTKVDGFISWKKIFKTGTECAPYTPNIP